MLIERSDEVWARSGILAHLPRHLTSLSITSDTSLPAGRSLRALLAPLTALQALTLGAGYGVVSEQVGGCGFAAGGGEWYQSGWEEVG